MKFPAGLKTSTGAQRVNPKSSFGSLHLPAYSSSIHPIFDQVTAGILNDSCRDRKPFRDEGVVGQQGRYLHLSWYFEHLSTGLRLSPLGCRGFALCRRSTTTLIACPNKICKALSFKKQLRPPCHYRGPHSPIPVCFPLTRR